MSLKDTTRFPSINYCLVWFPPASNHLDSNNVLIKFLVLNQIYIVAYTQDLYEKFKNDFMAQEPAGNINSIQEKC